LQKNILKERKKLFLFLSLLLIFGLFLTSCNWFGEGILNVFDPKSQIIMNITDIEVTEDKGTIDLAIYTINEVGFDVEGFDYKYYNSDGEPIDKLKRTVGMIFSVKPSSPGTEGDITNIEDLPLYYKEVSDYVKSNPMITEITCTISLFGTDWANHSISKSVTFDYPAIEPGMDFEPPTAVINVTPGTTGNAPFTVQFDASGSTDDRGIASYSWDFGDGSTGTGVMPPAHNYVSGVYIVKLTVTDYWDNTGIAIMTINVGSLGAPTAVINVTPGTSGLAPFTVFFDASDSSLASDGDGCGSCSIESYNWDFGDGESGTGITISHTYDTAGAFNVVLTVTDTNGTQGYDSVQITVSEAGAPSEMTITASPQTMSPGGGTSTITVNIKDANGNPVTDGTEVNFTASAGTLTTYSSTTTGGISQTVLSLTNAGAEIMTSTVSATCASVTDSVVVSCPPPTP
jgi:PKD repeat protein